MSTAVLGLIDIILDQIDISVFGFDGRMSARLRMAAVNTLKRQWREPLGPVDNRSCGRSWPCYL